tara:strand:+ start:698 stop:1348 length:651 start_codon:yes stop_codon:yes gene_type:complete
MTADVEKVLNILTNFFEKHETPTVRATSEKRDPFKTLISCLLSLRTQDKNTEKASKSLFAVADTPEKIIALPQKKLEKLIFSSGYYRAKARSLKHVSEVILKEHNGKVPSTEEELLAIKGIGRKTANIVLCFAYNKNVIPVDTHLNRIPNRLGWVKTRSPEETEFALMEVIPKKYWRELNTLLIKFGKHTCLPISPHCSKCPIKNHCQRIGVGTSR